MIIKDFSSLSKTEISDFPLLPVRPKGNLRVYIQPSFNSQILIYVQRQFVIVPSEEYDHNL